MEASLERWGGAGVGNKEREGGVGGGTLSHFHPGHLYVRAVGSMGKGRGDLKR